MKLAFEGGHVAPLSAASTTYKDYNFKPRQNLEGKTRLTSTFERVTTTIQVVTRSPLGILVAGLLMISVLLTLTLVNRASMTPYTLCCVTERCGQRRKYDRW
jgi:hypothetical protein